MFDLISSAAEAFEYWMRPDTHTEYRTIEDVQYTVLPNASYVQRSAFHTYLAALHEAHVKGEMSIMDILHALAVAPVDDVQDTHLQRILQWFAAFHCLCADCWGSEVLKKVDTLEKTNAPFALRAILHAIMLQERYSNQRYEAEARWFKLLDPTPEMVRAWIAYLSMEPLLGDKSMAIRIRSLFQLPYREEATVLALENINHLNEWLSYDSWCNSRLRFIGELGLQSEQAIREALIHAGHCIASHVGTPASDFGTPTYAARCFRLAGWSDEQILMRFANIKDLEYLKRFLLQ